MTIKILVNAALILMAWLLLASLVAAGWGWVAERLRERR
jgi:hypothetical protein